MQNFFRSIQLYIQTIVSCKFSANNRMYTHIRTHTHTLIYMYLYVYVLYTRAQSIIIVNFYGSRRQNESFREFHTRRPFDMYDTQLLQLHNESRG